MEMRALWSKPLFSPFFRFISRYLENGHEKGMSIFENPKRELKKNVKSEIPTSIKDTQAFSTLKHSLHM